MLDSEMLKILKLILIAIDVIYYSEDYFSQYAFYKLNTHFFRKKRTDLNMVKVQFSNKTLSNIQVAIVLSQQVEVVSLVVSTI